MQKARRQPGRTIGQRLLVSTWFQKLFHSPPGVLFNVRSRYFSLSVYQEYLALEGGPPMFTPGFTRLALLRNSLGLDRLSYTGLSPGIGQLSNCFY